MTTLPTTGPPTGPVTSRSRRRAALRMTPGRWITLVIGVPILLAFIGWSGFSLVASIGQASFPVSATIPVKNGRLVASTGGGDITVHQGQLSDGGDLEASGFSSDVTLSAGGGNLTASNLDGNLKLDTGGGDMTGSGLAGTIQIGAEGGSVNVSNLNGLMRLDTGGGDLTGNGLTGELQMSTEGGNVQGSAVDSQQVNVQSGGGDVTLVFTQPPQDLRIVAEGGNVNVILPNDATTYDISTPDNQGANLNISSALVSSASHHTISVDSGGGDITISQAG